MLLILVLATLLTCHKNTEQKRRMKKKNRCNARGSIKRCNFANCLEMQECISFVLPSHQTRPPRPCQSSPAQPSPEPPPLASFFSGLPCEFLHAQWLHRRRLLAKIMKVGRAPLPNWVPAHTAFEIYTEANPAATRGTSRVSNSYSINRNKKILRIKKKCKFIVEHFRYINQLCYLTAD